MTPFHRLILDTQRLQLRPLQEEDASALLAIFSNPQVMRYWSSAPWSNLEQARELIASDRRKLPLGLHLRLGIILPEANRLIGTCSLFNLSRQNRRAEIGYALTPSVWGRGYMQEALTTLLSYAFDNLDLNRLEADIDPRNLASEKSLLRLGFLKEGLLRERWIVSGEVSDSSLFGLLRQDWLASKNPSIG